MCEIAILNGFLNKDQHIQGLNCSNMSSKCGVSGVCLLIGPTSRYRLQ